MKNNLDIASLDLLWTNCIVTEVDPDRWNKIRANEFSRGENYISLGNASKRAFLSKI